MLSVYLKGWRIDHALEDSRSVREPERKDQVFIVSNGDIEGCLSLIALMNVDKMIGVAEV